MSKQTLREPTTFEDASANTRRRAASQLIMPDSSREALAARGVRVGSLIIHPDGGPYNLLCVTTDAEPSKQLRGDGALAVLFAELTSLKRK